jgi:hypothetical protein
MDLGIAQRFDDGFPRRQSQFYPRPDDVGFVVD